MLKKATYSIQILPLLTCVINKIDVSTNIQFEYFCTPIIPKLLVANNTNNKLIAFDIEHKKNFVSSQTVICENIRGTM